MMKPFDILVLGSGIAGLFFALKSAPRARVAIITKKTRAESNTNYAQGGIAAVTSREDSFEMHVRDTLEAGAGLCREEVVRTMGCSIAQGFYYSQPVPAVELPGLLAKTYGATVKAIPQVVAVA